MGKGKRNRAQRSGQARPEISVKPFDREAFANLLMNPNVRIIETGGFDLDDPDDDENEQRNSGLQAATRKPL